MFLGVADTQPFLGETRPQTGRTGQSHSPSEVRRQETQPHLEGGTAWGLVTSSVKAGSGQKPETKNGARLLIGENRVPILQLSNAIFTPPAHALTHLQTPKQSAQVS